MTKSRDMHTTGETDWGGDPDGRAEFSVMLSLDGETFELTTILDWKTLSQVFQTYREGHGKRPGWNPPEYFRSIFENKTDFADLLILDGEKARTLNRSHGKDTIGRAIRQVTGLGSICDLIDENGGEGRISELIRELEKTVGSGVGGNKNFENNLIECETHRKYLEEARDEVRTKLDILTKKFFSLSNQIIELDNKFKGTDTDFDAAVSKKEEEKSLLDSEVKSVLKQLFNPGDSLSDTTWGDVRKFYSSQIRGKLPGEATGDWFKEIVEDHDACICGTAWNETMKKNVLQHSEMYVDGRIQPRVKTMQRTVVESRSTTNVGELKAGLDALRFFIQSCIKKREELRKGFPEEEYNQWKAMVARQREMEVTRRDLENEYNFYNSENRDFIYANGLHAYTTTSNEEYNYITIQPHIFKQIMNISEIKKVEQNLRVLRIKTGSSAKRPTVRCC